jgi:3-keto-5-aminohexanoate cleavage enzyme
MGGSRLLAVAPNGARKSQLDVPALPVTADELAITARQCRDAGAAMIHLHVREADGRHSLNPDLYRAAIASIEAMVGADMLIQVTTEAAGRYHRHEQIAMMHDLRPASASVGLREMFLDGQNEGEAVEFYAWCHKERIVLQHILYDAVDLAKFKDLLRRGVISDEKPRVLFVLGRRDQDAMPLNILPFMNACDPSWIWMACAFGPNERNALAATALMGGHVRVGFENNITLSSGMPAQGNDEAVADLAKSLNALGIAPASVTEAHEIMGTYRG